MQNGGGGEFGQGLKSGRAKSNSFGRMQTPSTWMFGPEVYQRGKSHSGYYVVWQSNSVACKAIACFGPVDWLRMSVPPAVRRPETNCELWRAAG